jgi:hypothetical protein
VNGGSAGTGVLTGVSAALADAPTSAARAIIPANNFFMTPYPRLLRVRVGTGSLDQKCQMISAAPSHM